MRRVLSFIHVPQAFCVITNVALKELEDKGKARAPGHPQTLPPTTCLSVDLLGCGRSVTYNSSSNSLDTCLPLFPERHFRMHYGKERSDRGGGMSM